MLEKLRDKLKLAVNFPSPPAIAQQIIDLAADPDIDVGKVAGIMGKDPGLTAKILRIANSPLYAKQRRSENLRQALVVLGLNAATTLALSFSLLGTYKSVKASRIDYVRFWRRAILGASAARSMSELIKLEAPEDVFLASLLQDIAVLAVDRVQPDFYDDLSARADHAQLIAHEIGRLGTDHAALGAWLLRHWRLPEPLCTLVEWSHAPEGIDSESRIGLGSRCVALGSECAEILLGERTSHRLAELCSSAGKWLGLPVPAFAGAIENLVAQLPEIERLYDTALLEPDACAAVLEQARELLMIRSLQSIQQLGALQELTQHFEARTAELEDRHRRDAMTGVFNRGYLDQVLEAEFRSAAAGGWPLSIIFADLDRFKDVNDTYGHPAGDAVLVATANVIQEVVRDTDCVARYGGEEFIIVLPGLGADGAQKIAERLLARLRAYRHPMAEGWLTATVSLGLATHDPGTPFVAAGQLLEAADRSLYAAKRRGRDRLVRYDRSLATTAELETLLDPAQTCPSRSLPPRAAATLEMNAPTSNDNAM